MESRSLRAGRDAALVGCIVLAAGLAGGPTRAFGTFAAFWPANALLLGLMVRYPLLSRGWCWAAALVGYVASSLIVGNSWLVSLWLTAADLSGVAVGVLLFRRLPEPDRRLRRPISVLYLCAVAAVSALVVTLIGCGAPVLPGQTLMGAAAFWFTTEFVNAVVVLPVVLAAPDISAGSFHWRRIDEWRNSRQMRLLPIGGLLVSLLLAMKVGGPGAIAFSVPALLWCALSFSLFPAVVLTLAVSVWTMVALASGAFIPLDAANAVAALASLQLGMALIALGPLTVASVNAARGEVVRALDRAASHDFLTDVLSRSAFMTRGAQVLAQPAARHMPLAVLMLDVDHFKSVNDSHGHSVGDKVLVAFAGALSRQLREHDLFGRLGGEEFAVIMGRIHPAAAMAAAERLRQAVERLVVPLDDGRTLRITVSIGVASRDAGETTSLDTLLARADKALYRAKSSGRNRVAEAEPA